MDNQEKHRSQWDAKYRDTHREKLREAGRARRRKAKQEVLDHYGSECAVCGFSDPRALQIDHIANNGADERRSLGGQQFSGWRFYVWLKKSNWPDGYQTLCANCNNIKQYGLLA